MFIVRVQGLFESLEIILKDMTKVTLPTQLTLKMDELLPASHLETALKTPLKQTLWLAEECRPGYSLLLACCV